MLSRIADSLFWMARYMERAEDTARILDVNYHMLLEQSQQTYRLRWEPLIVMAGEENRFRKLYGEANAQNVFEFLAFRQDNPNSIVQCIAKARENARTIRDRISREMWEDINGLYHMMIAVQSAGRNRRRAASLLRRHQIRQASFSRRHRRHAAARRRLAVPAHRLVAGARGDDRAPGGRAVSQSCSKKFPRWRAADNHQWMAVLKSVGAFEAYHRQYHSPIEPEKVAEMLILHPLHPRSIRFSTTRSAVRACGPSAARARAPTPTRPNGWPARWSSGSATTKSKKFSSRGCTAIWANCFECAARSADDIARNLLLLRGGGMNRYRPDAHDRIRLRRAGFGKLQRSAPAADSRRKAELPVVSAHHHAQFARQRRIATPTATGCISSTCFPSTGG